MLPHTLTPLDESHLDALVALYQQCEDFLSLGPRPHASPEMVLGDLELSRQNGGVFYGVYVAGALAGVFDVIERGFNGDPHAAYLELLMIAQGFRNQGLGEQIVRDFERKLLRSGIEILEADVQVNNPGGQRFWARMGFTVVSEPRLQEDGTTSVHLRKPLQPIP